MAQGLLDFAIGLVNAVFNLPDGQVKFFEEFECPNAGLEITAGQRTMSGLTGELTSQLFVLPVMLTGHNRSY